jgi:heme exporter protein C
VTDEGAGEASFERGFAACARISGWLLVAALPVYVFSVVQAPIDRVQGIVQKILYVHPPCAFAAYAGFLLTAVFGALYLWKDRAHYDRAAAAAAEVGVLFCALMLVTGPIWGKATWGRWWSWDLRLTLTLLLFLVYLAYLLLRSFTEGDERAARFSAVYGIAGLLVIPLNYFAIDLGGGRSMHPEKLERGSLGEGMGLPFLMGGVCALLAFTYLWSYRVQLAGLTHRAASSRVGGAL